MSKSDDAPAVVKAKDKAKHLHSILKRRCPDISLGECLDIYAKLNEARNWNTLLPTLRVPPVPASPNIPAGRAFARIEEIDPEEMEYISLELSATSSIADLKQAEPYKPYITEYSIDIVVGSEDSFKIGLAKATLIHGTNALNEKADVFETLDSHSQEMMELHGTVIDDEWSCPLFGHTLSSDFLYVDYVYLIKDLRGYGFGKAIVMQIIRELMNQGIAIVDPYPLSPDAFKGLDIPATLSDDDLDKTIKKLERYFASFGFESTGSGEPLVMNLEEVTPNSGELLKKALAKFRQ